MAEERASQEIPIYHTDVNMQQDQNTSEESPSNKGVRDITQEMSQVSIELYDINNSNYDEIVTELNDAIQTIPSATEIYLESQRQLLDFVAKSTKKITLQQNIRLTRKIGELSLAVQERSKAFQPQVVAEEKVQAQKTQTTSQQAHVQPQGDNTTRLNADSCVQYFHLYQFMNDMNFQMMRENTEVLPQIAKKQLTNYKAQGMIDSVVRRNNPNRPYSELFKIQGRYYNSQLTKDQCQYLLNQITPTANAGKVQSIEMPTFNPDFQFYWSVLFNTNKYSVWKDFQGEYRTSRIHYNQEKKTGLSIQEIEAKFAFEVGCKWIQVRFDVSLNLEFNEKFGFNLANGYLPNQATTKDNCRCLLARGMDNGVWDGEYVYFHADEQEVFVRAFCRLHDKMHVSFKVGTFAIHILTPGVLPHIAHCMPQPKFYEQMLPIHCGWLNLNKSQITNMQKQRYSSCLGYGGVYLPYFSHSKGAVTGKLINMIPRFANIIEREKETDLFQWNIEKAQFLPCETPKEQLFKYQKYMGEELPTLEAQEEKHNRTKPYDAHILDRVLDRVYGSMHFWSWYDRTERTNTIANTPNTIRVEFSNGNNPYFPESKNDPQAAHFLLSSNKELSASQKETLYRTYVDQECAKSLEASMRFRRTQCIMGYNSPQLCWHQPQGTQLQYRFPTAVELLGIALPQTSIDFFRTVDFSCYTWIPKVLAPHYDVVTDTYFKSQKDLFNLRLERANEVMMQQHSQPTLQSTRANKRYKKK